MSRPSFRVPARPVRRGAALACVFAGVLAAGAATGSWGTGFRASDSDDAELVAAPGPARPGPARDAGGGHEHDGPGGPGGDADLVVSRSGDRWSAAYSAEEYAEVEQSLAGEYVGTGIAVARAAGGRIEVSEVHEGSPAEQAGILPGDVLRTIDGVPLVGGPVTDVVSRLRGSDRPAAAGPGSTVRLGLQRGSRRWEAEVERARLTEETVTVHRETAGVTRIHVSSFTRGSAELLRAAAESAPEGDGIVLDLRGNAGGLITEAAEAASVFLDGGLVATYDVHGSQRSLHAQRGGDTRTPLVVLVDSGTMSSAELLTGALQDRNRAVIVGSSTFGKSTVQMPSEQPDGSVAELTVGHYATPSGRVVKEDQGITPDLAVAPGEDAEDSARTVLDGLATGT